MELALYDSKSGYYARAAKRSGRAGDFFTSIDVGPMFGELLEVQLAEMAQIIAEVGRVLLDPPGPIGGPDKVRPTTRDFDLLEVGAGNGRLAADILRAARTRDPAFYNRIRLHLVETSAEARAAQRPTLEDVADRLVSSSDVPPTSFEGALVANELLDSLPAHQVIMREDGLREVYVGTSANGLITLEGPPSTPALAEYLARLDIALEPGWRVEINLRAIDWVREAAQHLRRGFIVLIDYGHEARELYSLAHAGGTLTTFSRHTMAEVDATPRAPRWLDRAGEQDITAHVDFTSVREAAEAEGLVVLGFLDQTYFLMGLLTERHRESFSMSIDDKDSRCLKTLLMPGGLGSTHKVMILGKQVGTPALRGCSYRMRVT